MKALLALALLTAVAACSPKTTDAPPVRSPEMIAAASQNLKAFLDLAYEEELSMSPMQLTRLGRKEQYDTLDDMSEAGEEKLLNWRRGSVAKMKGEFTPDELGDEALTSYDIWALELERAELRARYRRHAYVFGFGGPHTDLPSFLMTYHKVDTKSDMQAFNARLGALATAMDQVTDRARLAAADGVRTPKFNYEKAIKESKGMITGQPFGAGPDSPLWADAMAKIKILADAKTITADEAKTLTAGAKAALIDKMKPAYERTIAWLESDMGNASSGKVGALTLPDGAAWYQASLELLTTTKMQPEDIHALGLSEVERIHAEMDAIRQQVGYTGDLKAFFDYTRTDAKFYLPSTDAGRARYIEMANGYLAAMKTKLPEYFGRLPKADLVVKRVEAYREAPGAAAHYFRPTPDGKQPGIFYAHLIDMSAVSVWALESLSYHEGVPGHHMQIAIATELDNLPMFRTRYNYTAFSEGWGLYAEGLGKEMGFFTEPYNDYGRLSSELWRAVRLVVDTGLHAKGWTEEEGVAWALANSPRPEAAIRSEVRRFLGWPGQATAYKIGQLKILELRESAKKELGDAFDIKGFHDTVIGAGSLPLSVVEKRVQRWVEEVKGMKA